MKTPNDKLFEAIRLNQSDRVRKLLRPHTSIWSWIIGLVSADIDAKDKQGNTPLMCALENSSVALCQLLMKYHPDLTLKNRNNQTALSSAVMYNRNRLIAPLIKQGAPLNPKDGSVVPLAQALYMQNAPMVKLLLKHGADVTIRDRNNWAMLIIAVYFQRADLVKLLLKHKAPVNICDTYYNSQGYCLERTPLILALKNNSLDIAELLLEAGADVNQAVNDYSQSPLLMAIQTGSEEALDLLLEHKVDVNAQGGYTRNNVPLIALYYSHMAPDKKKRFFNKMMKAGANAGILLEDGREVGYALHDQLK